MKDTKNIQGQWQQSVYHFAGLKPENENGPNMAFFLDEKGKEKYLSYETTYEIYLKAMEQEAARLFGHGHIPISNGDRELVTRYQGVEEAMNGFKANSPKP